MKVSVEEATFNSPQPPDIAGDLFALLHKDKQDLLMIPRSFYFSPGLTPNFSLSWPCGIESVH